MMDRQWNSAVPAPTLLARVKLTPAHPDLLFLVYHSRYEVPRSNGEQECGEGPFVCGVVQRDTDRLIQGLRDAGISPAGNAARFYGVDEEKALARARNDSLAWIRDAMAGLQPCV